MKDLLCLRFCFLFIHLQHSNVSNLKTVSDLGLLVLCIMFTHCQMGLRLYWIKFSYYYWLLLCSAILHCTHVTCDSKLSQLPILYSYVSSLVPNPKEGGMAVWLKEICRFCILILSTVTQQKYFLCASNGLLRVQPLQLVSKQNKRKTNKLLASGADLQYSTGFPGQ